MANIKKLREDKATITEAIKGLKALRREAKEAIKTYKELEKLLEVRDENE